jgi:hypothetical protein
MLATRIMLGEWRLVWGGLDWIGFACAVGKQAQGVVSHALRQLTHSRFVDAGNALNRRFADVVLGSYRCFAVTVRSGSENLFAVTNLAAGFAAVERMALAEAGA